MESLKQAVLRFRKHIDKQYPLFLKAAFFRATPFLFFLIVSFKVEAQQHPGIRTPLPGEERNLLNELEKSKHGNSQVELLLSLGAYYLFLPGEEKEDLNKAMFYVMKASKESLEMNFTDGYVESLYLKGNILIEDEQNDLSKPVLDSAISLIQAERKKGKFINHPERELRALLQSGKIYLLQLNLPLSERSFLEALKLSQARGFSVSHYIYHQLAILEMWKGDWNRSLFYELEAIRSMEAAADFSSAGWFYNTLGFIYRRVGQFQRAIDYFEMAYDFYSKKPSSILFELCAAISEAMTKLERPLDGITQLNKKIRIHPPSTFFDKRQIESALTTCYRVLKQYDSAEVHLLRLLQIQRNDRVADRANINKMLGQLYVEWGKYGKAKPYLAQSLESGFFSGRALSHLYFLLFKADSAAGSYLTAIDYLMKNKKIDEVLYREAKTRENQELQIKYDTEKKDKDIEIKARDILLLTRLNQIQHQSLAQTQLKFHYDSLAREQNIKLLSAESAKKDKDLLLKQQSLDLLSKKDQLKQSSLRQATLMKNITFIAVILLFIIIGLLYNQYRIKQRSNKEIREKNLSLMHLLNEKEWLLKEVHHRVKNNLHTIMSLLETQSAFLKDDALAAVQNSQHRVYAMSLVHQKLYQVNNSSSVNMAVYLPELLNYLRDSYDLKQRIQFVVDIKDIQLDISKAIPVGLIVNEAVTNSIKYAFPGNRTGAINISMGKITKNRIRLSISDNGVGMPSAWDNAQRNSFGLKLMKGLSDDIRGKFLVDNSNGTMITIEFIEQLFSHEPEQNKVLELQ